ncbi:hypothetical protein [Flavobacterium selenitireducens]|uniref:hypothetical protein n=1 Tax=Flavobacterium selenitireducens TaxID=2722704 RepID=UPI00168A66F2|nr:hypothetical protein [Flavobacterium selenitireducens]MBD3581331.1 hypothetical protein [Flavobacterium selenitireducens]
MKTHFSMLMGLLCLCATAQEKQQVQDSVRKIITDKFPRTRTFDLQYRAYAPSDFESELFDQKYVRGRITDHQQWKAAMNFTLLRKQRWNLSANVDYRYESFNIDNPEIVSDALGPFSQNEGYHYIGATIGAMYYASLFKKPIIYIAALTADGSQREVERLKGTIGATLLLKRTERTVIGLGFVILLDPASPVPAAPVFTVDHKFKNSAWSLDLILPQRLMLKRPVFSDGRVSIGTELSGDGFYMYADNPGYADVYDFRQLELRSGLTYEHSIANGFVAYAKTGIANMFNMRVSERAVNTNDYILSAHQDATGYLSFGLSYNLPSSK